MDTQEREKIQKLKEEMYAIGFINIVYPRVIYGHQHSEDAFFYWLDQVRAVNSYELKPGKYDEKLQLPPAELHVRVDPILIDYSQVWSLWKLFDLYKVEGREQLEALAPYLTKFHEESFMENFVIPWKKKLAKKVKKPIKIM
ncbi:MAG: hypothetical protein WA364_13165 [Candidatus Nitrosopolaris sp.]